MSDPHTENAQTLADELLEQMLGDSLALPSDGEWVEIDGSTYPRNSLTKGRQRIEELQTTLRRIANIAHNVGRIEFANQLEAKWAESVLEARLNEIRKLSLLALIKPKPPQP